MQVSNSAAVEAHIVFAPPYQSESQLDLTTTENDMNQYMASYDLC